jgi:hypothetical protein
MKKSVLFSWKKLVLSVYLQNFHKLNFNLSLIKGNMHHKQDVVWKVSKYTPETPSTNIISKFLTINVPDLFRIKLTTLLSHSLYSKDPLPLLLCPTLCTLCPLITLFSHSQHSFAPLLMKNKSLCPEFSGWLFLKNIYWLIIRNIILSFLARIMFKVHITFKQLIIYAECSPCHLVKILWLKTVITLHFVISITIMCKYQDQITGKKKFLKDVNNSLKEAFLKFIYSIILSALPYIILFHEERVYMHVIQFERGTVLQCQYIFQTFHLLPKPIKDLRTCFYKDFSETMRISWP